MALPTLSQFIVWAPLLAKAGFCPIIEPVRENLGGLTRALDAVVDADGSAVVIVNPHHGEFAGVGEPLSNLLKEKYLDLPNISAGILLKPSMTLPEAMECFEAHANHAPVFIHRGFTEAKGLAASLGDPTKHKRHVFFDSFGGKLYQRHFKENYRVLLKDGFERNRNADYEFVEHFSDLHATFAEEGLEGKRRARRAGSEFAPG